MLPEKRTKTNVGVGMGVLLQLAGFFFFQPAHMAAILGLVLILVSIPVFVWGCMNYAEGKGHSKWVGLVGLAGIIGLIVLILLPDQASQDSVPRQQLRKFVGLIFIMAGFALVVFGRWVSSVFWQDARFDRPADVCTLVGAFLGVVGLVMFTLGNARR